MNIPKFPQGWDEERVRRVLQHYDAHSDEDAVAEDEAAFQAPIHTAMQVPETYIPEVDA